MNKTETQKEKTVRETIKKGSFSLYWKGFFSWGLTIFMVVVLIMVLLKINLFSRKAPLEETNHIISATQLPLPSRGIEFVGATLYRIPNIKTTIPEGTRFYPIKYTVKAGDSIFRIAKKYDISAETILWANYDLLGGDPTFLKEGWQLSIPPTSGVYYKWQKGDTIVNVAQKYLVAPEDIIFWPGNHLDVMNPTTDNLENIMIPGGYREVVSWIKPLEFSPRSGAARTVQGPGGCVTPTTGPVGSGYLQWPVGNHYLSGFEFSSQHLASDITAAVGTPVYAADSGTVVYAGWEDSGYGNLVAIDHNNGYKTLYAHLSSIVIACGTNVSAGQIIAYSGSTGKSTGGHLHLEVRYFSQFIDPMQVLP